MAPDDALQIIQDYSTESKKGSTDRILNGKPALAVTDYVKYTFKKKDLAEPAARLCARCLLMLALAETPAEVAGVPVGPQGDPSFVPNQSVREQALGALDLEIFSHRSLMAGCYNATEKAALAKLLNEADPNDDAHLVSYKKDLRSWLAHDATPAPPAPSDASSAK